MARDAGRLRDVTGLQAVQLVVAEGSVVAGALVKDVRWPERTILTGVRRGREAIVPEGGTAIAADDTVVALTAHPEELRALLRATGPSRADSPPPDVS